MNEADFYILGVAIIWWTITVICISAIRNLCEDWKGFFYALPLALLWPFTLPACSIAIFYRTLILSTRSLRIDLHNRGLLQDFEEWLATRDCVSNSQDDRP